MKWARAGRTNLAPELWNSARARANRIAKEPDEGSRLKMSARREEPRLEDQGSERRCHMAMTLDGATQMLDGQMIDLAEETENRWGSLAGVLLAAGPATLVASEDDDDVDDDDEDVFGDDDEFEEDDGFEDDEDFLEDDDDLDDEDDLDDDSGDDDDDEDL